MRAKRDRNSIDAYFGKKRSKIHADRRQSERLEIKGRRLEKE